VLCPVAPIPAFVHLALVPIVAIPAIVALVVAAVTSLASPLPELFPPPSFSLPAIDWPPHRKLVLLAS
jgi:hypothetical protein